MNCPQKYIEMTTQHLNNGLNGHQYIKNASTIIQKHEKTENREFNFNK